MATEKSGPGPSAKTAGDPEPKSGKLDAAVQGTLGRKLRETYDEVVREEVPDKFLRLLAELKKKEPGAGEGCGT